MAHVEFRFREIVERFVDREKGSMTRVVHEERASRGSGLNDDVLISCLLHEIAHLQPRWSSPHHNEIHCCLFCHGVDWKETKRPGNRQDVSWKSRIDVSTS